MAWKEMHLIECDECGDFEMAEDELKARDLCKEREWRFTASVDLCPRCYEEKMPV